MSMNDLVTKGKVRKPIHMILYGVHGIGKTTFASQAPNPVFITGEEIDEIESPKFPKVESWDQFIEQLEMVKSENHGYETLVVDTLDSIESLLWKKIINDDPKAKDMATACGGYGKGYVKASQMFTDVRDNLLAPIREKMNVVLLCHSSRNKVEDVYNHDSYDTFEMKLHKNNKGYGTYTVFCEWVSTMLFANFKVNTFSEGQGPTYAIGEGERVIYCTPRPTHDAKNRFNLPDELPMKWSELQKCVDNFYKGKSSVDIEQLKKEVTVLADKIGDEELRKTVISNLEGAMGDVNRLMRAKEYIRGVLNG